MKFLCIFAGALLAAALVEANTRDIENDGQTGQTGQWRQQYNNGRLNFNDKNWYNQGRNQKYNVNHLISGATNKQHEYENYEQLRQHQQHSGFTSDVISGSYSTDSNSQEEYIQYSGNNQNDAAYIVGHTSAKKMINFYSIVEKYINNGQIQNRWTNEPVELQQVTIPLPNHQFLNMNENKINGLNQGTIKSIKLNTENNNVDVDYHFNDLMVNGNLKTINGQKEKFQVKMLNTDVTVSTELYNNNLKTVDTFNEKLEMSLENSSMLEKEQYLNENTEALYLRNLKRTIEHEMIENSYNGLIACMRQEAQKEIFFPRESTKYMEIVNKKSGLKVALVETQNWRELDLHSATKISSLAVRPIKSGNGYRVKVNMVFAKQPSWESNIKVQKGEQEHTFKHVQFQANEIVATATMEGINQLMGGRQFNVADVNVNFNGLRFDVPSDELFAPELKQNLRLMLENNLAVVLKEQLKQEYQTYQQNPEQYNQCSRFTQSRLY